MLNDSCCECFLCCGSALEDSAAIILLNCWRLPHAKSYACYVIILQRMDAVTVSCCAQLRLAPRQHAAAVRLAGAHLSLDSCYAIASFAGLPLAAAPCNEPDQTSEVLGSCEAVCQTNRCAAEPCGVQRRAGCARLWQALVCCWQRGAVGAHSSGDA